MSLKPELIPLIPDETKRVAQGAFPTGNLYMRLRDELGTFYQDEQFVSWFPRLGQAALWPWRLALISVMPFVENLRTYASRPSGSCPYRLEVCLKSRIDRGWVRLLRIEGVSDPFIRRGYGAPPSGYHARRL